MVTIQNKPMTITQIITVITMDNTTHQINIIQKIIIIITIKITIIQKEIITITQQKKKTPMKKIN